MLSLQAGKYANYLYDFNAILNQYNTLADTIDVLTVSPCSNC